MKKRYIAFGLLALELATIPVSAQIIDKVVFSAPQKAIHVKVAERPGLTKFVVSSNAPFVVTSEGAIGEFNVVIQANGLINGNPFGQNAQMPGDAKTCTVATSTTPAAIYSANQKTAAQPGEIISQAVLVEIHYDEAITPDLKILTEKKARKITSGQDCHAPAA